MGSRSSTDRRCAPFDDVSDLRLARAEGVGSLFDVIVSLRAGEDGADRRSTAVARRRVVRVREHQPRRAGRRWRYREDLLGGRRRRGVGGKAWRASSARRGLDDDDSDDEDFDVGVDVNEEDEEEEEESDDDDEEEDDSDDSDADGDAREERSPGDSRTAVGAWQRDPQREIPELRRGASSELAADVSELGSEEEEEDDSDEDGAFELCPSRRRPGDEGENGSTTRRVVISCFLRLFFSGILVDGFVRVAIVAIGASALRSRSADYWRIAQPRTPRCPGRRRRHRRWLARSSHRRVRRPAPGSDRLRARPRVALSRRAR